jgi:peptidoglycan/LPS O-acetylase OafA/YrhL
LKKISQKYQDINISYNPRLMGLRGIAVILVLLYHLDFDHFSKGYYGVDIFFVLSGFFISKSIIEGLEKEKFSLILFFKKRFLRIFPLLIIVIIATNFAGFFLFTDLHLKKLGESSLFSIIGLSNFYFLGDDNYFSEISASKPLLHLWSISIEMQFYALIPFFLILFFKKRKIFLIFFPLILLLLFSCGFILSDGFYRIEILKKFLSSGFNNLFYLTPFRIYGFLFGIFAFIISKYNFYTKYQSSSVVVSGSLIVVASSIFLIILNVNHKFFKFLEFKFLQFSGKISYSIYLIHWPILIFFNYKNIYDEAYINTFETKSLLVLVIYILSYFTFEFIEQKFRYSSQKTNKANHTQKGISICIIFTLVISFLLINNKYINRGRIVTEFEPNREKISFLGNNYLDDIVLMGDSMIEQFYYYFQKLDLNIISFARGGCPMLPKLQKVRDGKIDKECERQKVNSLKYLEQTKNKIIIISLFWDGYFTKLYKKEENIKLKDHKQTKYFLESEYKSILLNSLEQLVKLSKKNHHKIIIIDHIYFEEIPNIIHKSQLPFKKKDVSLISFEKAKLKSKILKDIFSSNFELKKDFIYFNPYLRLCELECKKIVANNIFLMKDRIHFTPLGIDYINELNDHFLKKLISDLQSQSVY